MSSSTMERLRQMLEFVLPTQLAPGIPSISAAVWTVIVVITARLCLLFVKFVRWQILCRRATNHLPAPPRHWLYGHLKTDVGSWIKQHNPPICSDWRGPFLVVLTCHDPENTKLLLSTTEKNEFIYSYFKPWLGDGLFTVSMGSNWQRNRRLLTSAFHFDVLKPYVELFSESANVFTEKLSSLGPGASVEIFDHVRLMTLDNILKCSLGCRTNCQTESKPTPYIQALHDLTTLIGERDDKKHYLINFIYNLSESGKRFHRACSLVHSFSDQMIKTRREMLRDSDVSRPGGKYGKCLDFLDILLQAQDEDGRGLTDREIRDEVDTFLFGGTDTTASGISWTLYHVAKHPEYQDRCRREAEGVLQGRMEMKWDDISKLPFTNMCIKESLRRMPPVDFVARRLKQPVTLPDGSKLPKGLSVSLRLGLLHSNKNVWPDPETYDPEHFSPENSKKRHSHAFLPFSAGQRNCIGQNFAMSEMKVAVALILQRFRLELDDSRPPPVPVVKVTTQAEDGIWMKVHPVRAHP